MYRNVKAEMARRGMTLGMLADHLGLRLSTVSDKLNGVYPLTFNEAKKIKSILGVDMSLEELFEEYTEAV